MLGRFLEMHYVVDHWRGRLSLPVAFWVNFLLISVLVNVLESFLEPSARGAVIGGFFGEVWAASLVWVHLALLRGLLFVWQVVGVMRTCDRVLREGLDRSWVWGAYVAMLLAGIVTVISLFALGQRWLVHPVPSMPLASHAPYHIGIDERARMVTLRGTLAPGITQAFATVLAQAGGVRMLVLDSDGGRIYEARGLAKVVLKHGLDTHVSGQCKSSCTTAFLAGKVRTLESQAQIGFHAYHQRGRNSNPFVDASTEQETDREFFRQRGVAEVFLTQIFDAPPADIWLPSAAELLGANVAHAVVERPSTNGSTSRSR
ncbi:MAG: hypothetical protein ACI8PT_002540 [Gammaproteobacteria bacterium]|jgi:hypothetical protein